MQLSHVHSQHGKSVDNYRHASLYNHLEYGVLCKQGNEGSYAEFVYSYPIVQLFKLLTKSIWQSHVIYTISKCLLVE